MKSAKTSSPVKNGKQLLVVERDGSVARVLELAMRHGGFSVERVTKAGDAIDRLERGGVAGVLIDLGGKDPASVRLLGWLHSHEERPPWLVLSSMDASDVARIDDSIRERFISKPFDPWSLIERVGEMTAANGGSDEVLVEGMPQVRG